MIFEKFPTKAQASNDKELDKIIKNQRFYQ